MKIDKFLGRIGGSWKWVLEPTSVTSHIPANDLRRDAWSDKAQQSDGLGVKSCIIESDCCFAGLIPSMFEFS